MTYSLCNNCTKNYYNRTLAVQVIVEDEVTWIFLRHSVQVHTSLSVHNCCQQTSIYIRLFSWAVFRTLLLSGSRNFIASIRFTCSVQRFSLIRTSDWFLPILILQEQTATLIVANH